ncbi:glutathione S-transferase family protein [Sphingomonas antarctica]|uniref:glutathione S-transferase family protein n=1 Tax=Sphingomonas antarctica TaxID=2040274 RepID=UPI0039EA7E6F
MKLFIGNKAYSSWSLRGWLACKQSGLAFDEVVLPMSTPAWDQAQANELAPSGGKVPTLWDGDAVVWDSIAIIDYLNDKTGGTRFWPQDLVARGFARSIAAEMHSSFTALRGAHAMNTRRTIPTPATEAVQADIARIMELWAQARARFGGEGDFLFGPFGAVDIMFAPVCTRFMTYQLPIARFAQTYVDAVLAHPFMLDWIAAAQDEQWVIDKYEPSATA